MTLKAFPLVTYSATQTRRREKIYGLAMESFHDKIFSLEISDDDSDLVS